MSYFSYNGIVLSLTKINSIERNAVYSADGMEYLHTDFIIDINCIYNPGATSYNPLTVPIPTYGNYAPETDFAIRSFLMQPRRPIVFSEGGLPIINLGAINIAGDALDVAGGPSPIRCTINRMIGPKTFHMTYTIKVSIVECPSNTLIPVIASNRYNRTEQINDQYMSSVTTYGRAIFRSNVLAYLNQNADDFRQYIIPDVCLGFKRVGITVNFEPSGLAVDWSVTDIQVVRDLGDGSVPGTAAAAGITKLEGIYGVNTVHKGAMGQATLGSQASMSVRAWGTTEANNWQMIAFCMRLMSDKLPIGDPAASAWVTDFRVAESVMDRYVELSMGMMKLPDEPAGNAVQGAGSLALFDTFKYDYAHLPDQGGKNPVPPYEAGTRGTSAQQIGLAAFRRSCQLQLDPNYGDITGTIAPNATVPPGYTGQYLGIRIGVSDVLPVANTAYRKTSKPSIYTVYNIFDSYNTEGNVAQLPISTYVTPQNTDNTTPTCEVVNLFQRASTRSIKWEVERVGATPEIPSFDLGDYNYVLSDYHVTPIGIELMADGQTPIYRVNGQYDYIMKVAHAPNQPLTFDIPAWISYPRGVAMLDQYITGITSNQQA